jgi:hypothetical protein
MCKAVFLFLKALKDQKEKETELRKKNKKCDDVSSPSPRDPRPSGALQLEKGKGRI